jgi:hypothetical protein
VPRDAYRSYILLDAYGSAEVKRIDVSDPWAPLLLPRVRYMGRVGVSSSVDFGFQLTPGFAGLDAKWNFLRGPFDLSLAPEGDIGEMHGVGFRGMLPLLMGWNLGRHLTLVLVPATYVQPKVECDQEDQCTRHGYQPWMRFGAGMNIRLGTKFAIQPEVNVVRPFRGTQSSGATWDAYAGFGLAFGTWSEYEEAP